MGQFQKNNVFQLRVHVYIYVRTVIDDNVASDRIILNTYVKEKCSVNRKKNLTISQQIIRILPIFERIRSCFIQKPINNRVCENNKKKYKNIFVAIAEQNPRFPK